MKDIILQKLIENLGIFISGQVLSIMMGVSRTAVWKQIKELKNEGYVIESSPRRGYRLISAPDLLNSVELTYDIKTKIIGSKVQCLDVVDSTNNYAKKLAYDGCREGMTVVAGHQTCGRGRLGRYWNTMGKSGVWMSIVLRPSLTPEKIHMVTLASSVAVVRAIQKETGITTGIKWPNDIILNNKKVCGILTEMGSEADKINFVVVGIGVNINQDKADFPEELRSKATSLKAYLNEVHAEETGFSFKRSRLIKEILFEMEAQYEKIKSSEFYDIIREWKDFSVTIGKQVKAVSNGMEFTGVAEDITNDGKLVVRCEDGRVKSVFSGEISVRGIQGYL